LYLTSVSVPRDEQIRIDRSQAEVGHMPEHNVVFLLSRDEQMGVCRVLKG
jgi:hypothetical protein